MAVYLKYVLKNLEPIRIADDSTSQSGQTMSLRYIPGSTVKGIIVNQFVKEEDFEQIKKKLFSEEVKYLNAYPSVTEDAKRHELFPSPKGFYEDKAETILKNVVTEGEFDEGMKRAKTGRFAYFENNKICYHNVKTKSDLKILSNVSAQKDRNVFRNEFICAGTEFTGYIYVEEENLRKRMEKMLQGTLLVGNARSAGYGKCLVHCTVSEEIPFQKYAETTNLTQECYMMLLSNTVMRNSLGELCGLNLKELEKKMGVSGLEISYCATNTVGVKGYNRTWRSRIPSVMMYEAGSVFHFRYSGVLKLECMRRISEDGIGIRRNEGFGQVIFLKDYPNINGKRKINPDSGKKPDIDVSFLSEEERDTLKIIAKEYYRQQLEKAMDEYILEHPLDKGDESGSRLGILESFTTVYRYNPALAVEYIKEYYHHAGEKERKQNVHQGRSSMEKIRTHVEKILDKNQKFEDLLPVRTRNRDCVMGIPKAELLSETEIGRLKLEFLTKEIRYDNKKEVQ